MLTHLWLQNDEAWKLFNIRFSNSKSSITAIKLTGRVFVTNINESVNG